MFFLSGSSRGASLCVAETSPFNLGTTCISFARPLRSCSKLTITHDVPSTFPSFVLSPCLSLSYARLTNIMAEQQKRQHHKQEKMLKTAEESCQKDVAVKLDCQPPNGTGTIYAVPACKDGDTTCKSGFFMRKDDGLVRFNCNDQGDPLKNGETNKCFKLSSVQAVATYLHSLLPSVSAEVYANSAKNAMKMAEANEINDRKLESKITPVKQQRDNLKRENTFLKAEATKKDAEVAALKAKATKKDAEVASLKDENNIVGRALRDKEDIISVQRNEIDSLKRKIKEGAATQHCAKKITRAAQEFSKYIVELNKPSVGCITKQDI